MGFILIYVDIRGEGFVSVYWSAIFGRPAAVAGGGSVLEGKEKERKEKKRKEKKGKRIKGNKNKNKKYEEKGNEGFWGWACRGRNYLNLSAFRDGANPTTWALSAWVRWYARYLENLLSTSRILGIFLCSSSSTAEKDKQEERLASFMNVDLIRDAGSLVSLIEELCDMPDSLLVEGNKLLHDVVGFACGDYLSAVNEVVSRLSEFRVRVNCLSFGESVELMKALKRLENCKERLGLVFTVNKPSTEALWGLVEELKSGVGIVMADGKAISLGRTEKGTESARFNGDRVLKNCESVEFCSERFELNKLSSMALESAYYLS